MWHLSFARLFWKEYRTQRSVWLALLAGTVLLQVVLAASVGARGLGPGAIVLALVLSACYAAACAGILFAGEREEETDLALRQLPLRAVPLLGAKLLFAVITVPAFVGAALLGAWAVNDFTGVLLGESVAKEVTFFARAVAGSLVWGLFFSLLMRRVLVVVLCTAVAELIVSAIAGNVAEVHVHRVYFSILAGVACVDLWLGLRWAAGDVVRPVPRFRLLGERPERAASPRWEKLLAWGARRGTPFSRSCAALCWRELRAAAPFCTWWVLLGVLLVDLVPRLFGIGSERLFVAATPVVCGLMVGLPDQRRQTYRFLSERGVPAAAVWLCKQAVWLTLALTLVTLFAMWDYATAGRVRGTAESYQGPGRVVETVRHYVHVPDTTLHLPYNSPEDQALRWNFAVALCLSLYAIGQLSALWIRRSVLAAAAALIGAVLVGYCIVLAVWSDVPLARSTWPVALAWLAGTLLLSGRWLRGNHSWRTRCAQWAWVLLPVVGAAMASAAYRAHQAPLVDPGFQWPAHEYQRQQFDRSRTQQWQELLFDLQRYARLALGDNRVDPATGDRITAQVLALGQTLPASAGSLDPLLLRPGDDYALSQIGVAVADSARRKETAGLDQSWNEILAGLRVTRVLGRQCADWQSWSAALVSRNRLLTEARRWAAHPDQNTESLRAAFDALIEETREPVFAYDMLKNRYTIYSQLLQRRGRVWEGMQDETHWLPGGQTNLALACGSLPAFERERIHRLIVLATARSLGQSAAPGREFPEVAELTRWRASTLLLPPDFHGDLTGPVSIGHGANHELHICRTHEHATCLILALEHYRHIHGDYHDSLKSLVGDYFAELPHDPFSPARWWFGYAPGGFDAEVFVAQGASIPPAAPLLWSTGPGAGQIIRHPRGNAGYQATNLAFRSTQQTARNRTDIDLTDNGVRLSPNYVRFAILGLWLDEEWDYGPTVGGLRRRLGGSP